MFDQGTGQVFTESYSHAYSENDVQWIYRPQKALRPSSERSGSRALQEHTIGARSLQDHAIECVLKNVTQITREGIACLPVEVVSQIWERICER